MFDNIILKINILSFLTGIKDFRGKPCLSTPSHLR